MLSTISCRYGEKFDPAKHPQGTEIKAISYELKIHENEERSDIYIIVDI